MVVGGGVGIEKQENHRRRKEERAAYVALREWAAWPGVVWVIKSLIQLIKLAFGLKKIISVSLSDVTGDAQKRRRGTTTAN